LQTKNVPCHKRVSEIDLLGEEKVVVESDGEEWVDTQILSGFILKMKLLYISKVLMA
jgi:hypothetical protein